VKADAVAVVARSSSAIALLPCMPLKLHILF
jgi:hypothetical protein